MANVIDQPSPNHGPRPDGGVVDMLVLHYTGMRSAGEAIARLRDPAAQVSAHWLIDEDGTQVRLVAEDRRAWHAGVSSWRGQGNINDRSVGVEIVNPGHEFGYRPFPEAQIASVIALCQGILARHPIPPANVVGHSDVAPLRKTDPGELFPWDRLAAAGIGLWPIAAPPATLKIGEAQELLARIGYGLEISGFLDAETVACLTAFQRRYRRHIVDGVLDSETGGLLKVLVGNLSA